MALLTLHAMGYLVAWATQSLQTLLEELTDWARPNPKLNPTYSNPDPDPNPNPSPNPNQARCGACTHINNSAGLLAWLAGLGMWATSVERFRRSRYAAFFAAHQAPNLSAHPNPNPNPSPSLNPDPDPNPNPNTLTLTLTLAH